MRDKKAQALNMLTSGVILILIAIVTISIGISVNESMKTSFRGDAAGVTNETLKDMSNASSNSLANEDIASVSLAMNFTAAEGDYTKVISGNYTVDTKDGTIRLTGQGGKDYGGNDSSINYSYYPHPAAYNSSASGTTGLSAFGDYWTSIVSVIILVVIVGLFAYFRGGAGGIEVR